MNVNVVMDLELLGILTETITIVIAICYYT